MQIKKVDILLDSMDKLLEKTVNIPNKLDDIVNRLSKLERRNRTSETIVHNVNVVNNTWIPIINVGMDGDVNGIFCVSIKSSSQEWEYIIDMAMVLDEPTPIRILSVKENHKSTTSHNNICVSRINNINIDILSFKLLQNSDSCGTILLNIRDVGNKVDSVSVCIVDGPANVSIVKAGDDPDTIISNDRETVASQYIFSVAKNNTLSYWYGIEPLKNLTSISHEMTSCIDDNIIPLKQIQKVIFTIYDNDDDQFITISEDHKPTSDILTGNILLDRNDMCTINYTVTELNGSIVMMMMVSLGDYSYNSNKFELHKIEFNLFRGIDNEHRT